MSACATPARRWTHGRRTPRTTLEAGVPAPPFERRCKPANEARMTFVKQPIEFAASPLGIEHEIGIECAKDATQRADAQAVDPPSLEGGDSTLAHGRTARHVSLTPSEAVPEGSGNAAEARLTHATKRERRLLAAA